MVFGGIEHERLQLNEDTLWAGGPYDPSHAAAREALPRVRTLIAAGAFAEAERLIMDQVIARPPREMPYQTVGDVTITMAGGASATDYRRSLDLDTAIARTSFRVANTRYAREVFASPGRSGHRLPADCVRPRRAASAPGRLTATIAMSTPMAASVRAEGDDTLVLAGVNGDAFGIKGALTYQARVRVLVDGGSLAGRRHAIAHRRREVGDAADCRSHELPPVRRCLGRPGGGDAAGHRGRRQAIARGDPGRPRRRAPAPVPARHAGSREHAVGRAADRRAHPQLRRRRRPAARGAVLPVRPLPADLEFAARHAARQPAGHLERQHEPAVGQQLHHQHQHPDELLAGRGHQPRRVRRAALRDDRRVGRDGRANRADALRRPRMGAPSQHRPVAEHRAR